MQAKTKTSPGELARNYFQAEYGHLVNGQWVDGDSGNTITMINPATGDEISRIQAGTASDVKRAVDAAHAAFPKWSRSSPYERQAVLLEMARRLKARLGDYAMMETLNNGKPISESSRFDIPASAGIYDFYAGTPFMIRGNTSVLGDSVMLNYREALGVCAAIVPWNIPMFCTALKVAPALAAGNTVVLKPAESTCLAILEFFKECAGFMPPGIVNIVTGYGPDTGPALVTDPRVRKVAFTGSKPTARKIMEYASHNIIPQTMELGGKGAFIVADDADIDAAAEGIVSSTIFNKGEVCIAGVRVFAHEKIADELKEKALKLLTHIKMGDPTDPATQLGPLASQRQFDKVKSYLELGPREGAILEVGGKPARLRGLEKGLFIEPTIFSGVDNRMRIAQEEIFGPVTCMQNWSDDEEVIRLANETPYGLGSGIWSRSIARAHRFSRDMQTGMIFINRYYNFLPGMPMGGYKESGFGREGCLETLDHYTQIKSVVIDTSSGPLGMYPG